MTPFLASLIFCLLTTATADWRSGERQQALLRSEPDQLPLQPKKGEPPAVVPPAVVPPAVVPPAVDAGTDTGDTPDPTCKDLGCNMGETECSKSCKCGDAGTTCEEGEGQMFCCGTDCTGTPGCSKNGGDITVTVDLEFIGIDEKTQFLERMQDDMESMANPVANGPDKVAAVYKVVDKGDKEVQLFEVYKDDAQFEQHKVANAFLTYQALKGGYFPGPAQAGKTCSIETATKQEVKDKLKHLQYTDVTPYPFSKYPAVKKWVKGVGQPPIPGQPPIEDEEPAKPSA